MATSELKIIISATDKASPAVKSLETQLAGLAKKVVGVYTLKQGFDFLKDSVNKAAAEEKNLRTLQTVIENQGESWKDVKVQVSSYISELERNTMYTDEQLIPSMKQLVNAGMNVKQAMSAMNAVTDLATAKGIDLETSANLIGKAYMGNTDQLKRYGIEADSFNELMAKVNSKFGGSARNDMDGYAGSVKRLETTIEANQKMIGVFWIPVLEKANTALDKLFGIEDKPLSSARVEQLKGQISDLEKQLNKIKDTAEFGKETVISIYGREAVVSADRIKTMGEVLLNLRKSLEEEMKKEQEISMQKNQAIVDNTIESDNEILDHEIWLNNQIQQAGNTLKQNEIEAEKIKNQEIYNLWQASSQAMTALGVATNSATLKGMGIIINGVQNAINAVNAMMTASGPVGFILGLLGFVTSTANTVSSLNQLADLEKQNTALLETGTTGITTITQPETTTTSSGGGGTSSVKTVERSAAPTYYNINNTYNLNAGVVLGEETIIDKAFKELMRRYDQQTALVRT